MAFWEIRFCLLTMSFAFNFSVSYILEYEVDGAFTLRNRAFYKLKQALLVCKRACFET